MVYDGAQKLVPHYDKCFNIDGYYIKFMHIYALITQKGGTENLIHH